MLLATDEDGARFCSLMAWYEDPAWITAVGTCLAAVGTIGAFSAALTQIARERQRRHEDEERERQERHRAQARLISSLLGPVEQQESGDLQNRAVLLFNGSPEPVYRLVVGIVYIQGAAPRTIEEMLKALRDHQDRRWLGTTVGVLPSGSSRIWIRGVGGMGVLSGRLGTEVAFTDRDGTNWIRRATGRLEELPKDPFEYFEESGLHGPYDLEIPEPL